MCAAELIGARIRRIDAPSSDLWSITLVAAETRGALLVSLQHGASGVGWVAQRPHGQPATSFVQKLRKELEGGRLASLAEIGARLELRISRAAQEQRLVFEFGTQNVLLYAGTTLIASARQATGAAADEAATAEDGAGLSRALDLATLMARGAELLADRRDALFELRKTALLKALRTVRKRLSRKLDAIAGDAARAAEAAPLRVRGQLLLANLHTVPRGAKSARVMDYNVDPPAWVDIELDPALGTREQAESWFKRAKRFERGATLAAQRTTAGAAELAALDALEQEISTSSDGAALDALAQRAEKLGVRNELATEGGAAPEKSREPPRRVPYKTLYGTGGRAIFVGKGAADNDVLTREHARPQDLWLHARDVAGAHVVVPLERGEMCPNELLLDAAHLAAHFSDARGESSVDVSHTPRRYVRKPKGAPVGLVTLEREKVVRLQIEPARLARLLQSERT